MLKQLGISDTLIAARGFQAYAEAGDLEVAEVGENGREFLLIPEAALAWKNLKHAARNDGIDLRIMSAFRSVARQVEIIQGKLDAGKTIEEILSVLAPPGYSEHHTGRAVDVVSPDAGLEVSFADTAAFRWLQQHANAFGFFLSYPAGNPYGYDYEPWHWCYRVVRKDSTGEPGREAGPD